MRGVALRMDKLAELRDEQHLHTNGALARAMGVDPGNLTRILRGQCSPSTQFIAAALTTFPTTFEELFEVELPPRQRVPGTRRSAQPAAVAS